MCDDTFHSSSHHLQPAAVASAPLVPTVSHLVNHYLTRACLSIGHRHSLPLPSLRDVGSYTPCGPATSSPAPNPQHYQRDGASTEAQPFRHIDRRWVYQLQGRCDGGRINSSGCLASRVSTAAGVSTAGRAYRQQSGRIDSRVGVSTAGRAYRQRVGVSTAGGHIDSGRAGVGCIEGGRINCGHIDSTTGRSGHIDNGAGNTSTGPNDMRRCSPNTPPLVSLKNAPNHSEYHAINFAFALYHN